MAKSKLFEFLPHTADVKFKLYGKSLNEIFSNCALAVSHIISRGKKIKSVKRKEFTVSGKDYESLLYNFIDELIYLLDADNFVLSRADTKLFDGLNAKKINAVVYGDDASVYKDLDAIKSPTYAEMYVKQKKDNLWEAQIVVDV